MNLSNSNLHKINVKYFTHSCKCIYAASVDKIKKLTHEPITLKAFFFFSFYA